MTRLDQMLAEQRTSSTPAAPLLAVISGAVDPASAFAALDESFGALAPAPAAIPAPRAKQDAIATIAERIDLPLAQAAIGYSLAAPPPASREGLAMRMALYVLTHEYGGRLGDSAISDSGLTYYIGSDYTGDAQSGRIAITSGVDQDKLDPLETLLRAEILRLASDPPSAAELAAARSHIIGREESAAMDNEEIAAHLARTWLATGALPDPTALEARLNSITPADIARAARQFATGTILRVDVGPAPHGDQP